LSAGVWFLLLFSMFCVSVPFKGIKAKTIVIKGQETKQQQLPQERNSDRSDLASGGTQELIRFLGRVFLDCFDAWCASTCYWGALLYLRITMAFWGGFGFQHFLASFSFHIFWFVVVVVCCLLLPQFVLLLLFPACSFSLSFSRVLWL
jgi:hypothetical protein